MRALEIRTQSMSLVPKFQSWDRGLSPPPQFSSEGTDAQVDAEAQLPSLTDESETPPIPLGGPGGGEKEDLVDFEDVVKHKPHLFRLMVALVVFYRSGISALSLIAVKEYLGVKTKVALVDFGRNTGEVQCNNGVPRSWILLCLVTLAAFVGLEIYVALKTVSGRKLIRHIRMKLLFVIGCGAAGRWDAFSDVSFCFSIMSRECYSSLSYISFGMFFVGVMIAQVLPAIFMLVTQKYTHIALKFNDLEVFLEMIDPTRGNLELPEKAQKKMVGTVGTAAVDSGSLQGLPTTGASNQFGYTDADVQAVRQQVAEIMSSQSREDLSKSDPDDAKKKALIAQAKRSLGIVRFLCEDLGQGCVQALFLYRNMHRLGFWSIAFTLTSIGGGLFVSLGGPVYAFYQEYQNQRFYASMPKIHGGVRWQGALCCTREADGISCASSSLMNLILDEVQAVLGESRYRIRGHLIGDLVLKELNGDALPQDWMQANEKEWVSKKGKWMEQLAGFYNAKDATLELVTVVSQILIDDGGAFPKKRYKFKVFPAMHKGSYLEIDGDSHGELTMTRMP